MMLARRLLVAGTAVLAWAAAGVGCESTSAPSIPTQVPLRISPDSFSVHEEADVQLTAVFVDSLGHVYPVTGWPIAWLSADTGIAVVSDRGLVQGETVGETTIMAAVDVLIAASSVTVTATYQQVEAGQHACGITTEGRTYCWETVPVPVLDAPAFDVLTVGHAYYPHQCGVDARQYAYCWGSNSYGQLGDGSHDSRSMPVAVAGDLRFATVSAGADHTCGLTWGGTAYCWGANYGGQLGNASVHGQTQPTRVASVLEFTAISAGGNHTCAIDTRGVAFCWGRPGNGKLGDGDVHNHNSRTRPTPVAGDLRFGSVAAGPGHTCAITLQGELYCWGGNWWGELGSETNGECRLSPPCSFVPVPVATELRFQAVAPGGWLGHTCAVSKDGELYCWGDNRNGQLGTGGTTGSRLPVQVAGGHRFLSVTTGMYHSCGITTDHIAYCWGKGYGDTPQRLPYQFASPDSVPAQASRSSAVPLRDPRLDPHQSQP